MEYRHTLFVCFCLLADCFLHITSTIAWYTPDDICRTPDKKFGYCMLDNMCTSKANFLKENKVLSDEEKQALNRYSCGSDKVCCPTGNFSLDWLKGDCKTPDESFGRCISVESCKPILDFIEQNKNIGSAAEAALREYICNNASSSNDVKVCCPSKPIIIFNRMKETDDHSNHPNIQLLPNKCGVYGADNRIIGGKEARLNEYPWVAALKYQVGNKIEFKCAGSLISSRYVLTAAHCIQSPFTLIGVRLGEHNFTSDIDCEIDDYGDRYCAPPPQDFVVSKADATVHKEFRATDITLYNDIALIRLREDADISKKSVRTICLPIKPQEKNTSNIPPYTVIGWGKTAFEKRSTVLLKTKVYKQDISKCEGDQSTNTRRLCVGGRDQKDACEGDSGGPLSSEYSANRKLKVIQYGIVSYGSIICGKENAPTTYTNVPAFVEWILNNLKP